MIFSRSYNKLSDEDIMLHVSRENEKAFEEIHTRYARKIQGFFYRMLGNDITKAQDFTQELFLKIYEKRKSYNRSYPFSTWIFSIAYNLCKNEYRHLDIVNEHILQTEINNDAYITAESISNYDMEIMKKSLQECIGKLSREQFVLFTLRYQEELSIPEIATIINIPEGTVKSRMHTIMKLFKKQLHIYGTER